MDEPPQGAENPPPEEPGPEESSPEGGASPPRRRPVWRRVVRGLGIAVVAIGGLAVILLIAVRLYFSDDRVRMLALDQARARVPAEVELAGLELSLVSGIELRGLRVGPPEGFERDVVAFDRVAVRWSLWDLLFLEVIIDEVAIEGLHLCVEENQEHGRNLDVIIAALAPPSEDDDEEEPDSEEPFELAQPSLPVRVEVREIVMKGTSVEVLRPDLTASLNRFGIKGNFAGEGDAIDLALWVGLGEAWAPSDILVKLEGPDPISIEVKQRLGLDIATTGFGDVRVGLDLDTDAGVTRGEPLPRLRVTGKVAVVGDLLQQKLELSQCTWTIGEETKLVLLAAFTGFLGPATEQRLALQQLELRSRLDELSPIVGAFVPGMSLAGNLGLRVEPTSATVEGLSDPLSLSSRLFLELRQVNFAMSDLQAAGLDADIEAGATAGNADLTAQLRLRELVTAGQRFAGANLHLTAVSPLAPWLGESTNAWGPPPDVTANLELFMRRGGLKDTWSAERSRLRVDAKAPIDLILNLRSQRPLIAALRLDVARGSGGPAVAKDLSLRLDARAFDFAGKQVRANLGLTVADTVVQFGKESLRAPNLELNTDLQASGAAYTIHSFTLGAADLLEIEISGAVSEPASSTPSFDGLTVELMPFPVQDLFVLLPASWRPTQQLDGKVGFDVTLHGEVPLDELTGLAEPPAIEPSADEAETLRGWFAYLERWSARFARGMPFSLDVGVITDGVNFADDTNDVRGIDLETNVGMATWGPYFTTSLVVAEVVAPETARDLTAGLAFDIRDGSVNLSSRVLAGWYDRAELLRPLEGAVFDLRLKYKVGGDLLLEKLAVRAPDRPAELTLDGLIIKPVRMFLQNGWKREGLPGVEAELRWHTAFSSERLAPVAVGAPAVGGGMTLDGSLSVEDGLLVLVGGLDCDALSVRLTSPAPQGSGQPASETLIDTVSGQLPFDVRLAFRPHPDATPLALDDVGFGGGKIGLITSQHDIRNRPSRPVHYERLLPYRTRRALSIKRIVSGDVHLDNLELDAKIEAGIVAADRIALHLLGGDVLGELALQLSSDNNLLGQINFKMSNIDASYFKTLNLEPGPESELSGDINLGFLFSPAKRDLTVAMNLTKIGSQSFDRFLQFLSDGGKDEKIEDYRGQLALVTINEVAVWMRYEALNVDLDSTALIPGYRPIPRDMLRRYSLSGFLDVYLQPQIDTYLALALGWVPSAL